MVAPGQRPVCMRRGGNVTKNPGQKSWQQQEPRVVYFGIDNRITLWRLVNVCVSQVIV